MGLFDFFKKRKNKEEIVNNTPEEEAKRIAEEEAKRLTDALYDSNGAAEKMAETMNDNLKGDILETKSAWEALILSLEDGTKKGEIWIYHRLSPEGRDFDKDLSACCEQKR